MNESASATTETPLNTMVGVRVGKSEFSALENILRDIPPTSRIAFCVEVVGAGALGSLRSHLEETSSWKVGECPDEDQFQTGTVYLFEADGDPEGTCLLGSLAGTFGARCAAVLLTGEIASRWEGFRAVQNVGGLAIAATSRLDVEPENGAHSFDPLLIEVPKIAAALVRFALASEVVELGERDVTQLAEALQGVAGLDLDNYKLSTIERRIRHRMALTGQPDRSAYFDLLADDVTEREALANDLLIRVTRFFRDPAAFSALQRLVIEPLVEQADPSDALRVWIPGCATGEEAYSLVILFLEAMEQRSNAPRLTVFGTDLDVEALSIARAGIYGTNIEADVSAARLERYFCLTKDGQYQVREEVRDKVSFAVQDVVEDPPFSRLHLISFRNVLIYLRQSAKERVLSLLRYALHPGGVLFLGAAESAAGHESLFTGLDSQSRLYRRAEGVASSPAHWRPRPSARQNKLRSGTRTADPVGVAQKALLDARVPPSVVVSGDGRILHMHGDLGEFLQFPQGAPQFELLRVLREEFCVRVRAGMAQCHRDEADVSVVVNRDDGRDVEVRISPAPSVGERSLAITFEKRRAENGGASRADADPLVEQLDRELQSTRDELRETIAALGASNDELFAANEESMTMNEELQSANEELEVTMEEVRFVNRELTSVNSELREKLAQLERAHDDIANLVSGANVATVFFDRNLQLQRLTPAARELLGIDESDHQQHVTEMDHNLLGSGFVAEAEKVLDALVPTRSELRTEDGRWFERRLLPYRTTRQQIEGVVATFVEITTLRRAALELAVRERQQRTVAALGLRALEELSLQTFIEYVVWEVKIALQVDMCEILEIQPSSDKLVLRAAIGWNEGLVGTATIGGGLDSPVGYALRSSEPVIVSDFETDDRFEVPQLMTEHGVTSSLLCVIRQDEGAYGVLGVQTRALREFTRDDARFLQSVATIVASALNRNLSRQRLALESAVGKALSHTTDVREAVRLIFSAFGREMSMTVAELWEQDEEGKLVCELACSPTDELLSSDLERFSASPFEIGEGLVGNTFAHRRAVWMTTITDHRVFRRNALAEELGLHSSVGFPLMSGNEVLGVMTFFSRRPLFADAVFLGSLDAIGRAIGEFIRRTEAQREVRRRAAQNVAVLEASLDAILLMDHRGYVVEFNPAAEAVFGHTREEAIGQELGDLVIPPDLREAHRRGLQRYLESGNANVLGKRIDLPAMRKNGEQFPVEITIAAVRTDGPPLFAGFVRDISDQRKVEKAVRESERRFRAAFENAAVGFAMLDITDGRWIRVNDRVCEITGYPREELLSKTFPEITHPDDLDADVEQARAVVAGEIDHYSMEKRYIRADGSPIWVQLTVSVVGTEGGNLGYYIAVIEDIDARKRSSEALRESEWRFRQVLTNAPIPMMMYDEDGRVLELSQSWNETFGYAAEHLTDIDAWASMAHPGADASARAYLDVQDVSGGRTEAERLVRTAAGAQKSVVFRTADLGVLPDGRRLRVCAAADVTSMKAAERSLREASEQKDQFLAMLGHELRNPLSAIRSATELLKLEREGRPELQRPHRVLDRQTRQMGQLIDGLLDVSRIVLGKMDIERRPLDLAELVREVVHDRQIAELPSGFRFELDVPDAPLWVEGDAVRLVQVVDNLVSNAVKFAGTPGRCVVRAHQLDDLVLVQVIDNGTGVDPDLLPHIFEPFRQAKQELARSSGGLGLGLALVKGIMQLHDGEVRAESVGGAGTTFTISLPVARTPGVQASDTPSSTASRRVLVIEDNRDAADLLRDVLETLGHEVDVAYDGKSGAAKAAQFKPEIVLCDIGLPGEWSGFEVAAALRADAVFEDVKLVAVSGYGRPEDKANALAAGFDQHATKPVDVATLVRLLQ